VDDALIGSLLRDSKFGSLPISKTDAALRFHHPNGYTLFVDQLPDWHATMSSALACTPLRLAHPPGPLSGLHTSPACTPLRLAHLPDLHTCPACTPVRLAHLSGLHTCPTCTPVRLAPLRPAHCNAQSIRGTNCFPIIIVKSRMLNNGDCTLINYFYAVA